MHGILNALKRIQCMVCHRETPGFDIPYSDLRVLERGEKIFFSDKDIAKRLKKSKVLGVSVKLDPNFNTANQCIDQNKFFKGVCIDCSIYYHVDENNDIQPNQNYAECVKTWKASRNVVPDSSQDENPIEEIVPSDTDINVNDIAPYSDLNLMSTNIWSDEAYDMFVDTLTLAEKMVLTPVHMQVTIIRLRTNNIQFSCHGAICYPLRSILQARSLPWYEFHEIPFVVMTFKDKLGVIHEPMMVFWRLLPCLGKILRGVRTFTGNFVSRLVRIR